MNAAVRESLRLFLEEPEDPVEGALVVARIIDAEADVDWAREEISRLAEAVDASRGAAGIVRLLSERGFEGAGERYYEIDNSVLPHVLRERRGIPISLGVTVMGVARRLGLETRGINFPRHFLVTVGNLLLDPYAVAPTSVDACRRWLSENNVAEDGAFAVASPRDIVLRMLNNVRMLIQGRGDFVRALEISDCQVMVSPDAYGLYVERADAWLRLQAPEMVVQELEKALERAPDEAIAGRLRERIEQAGRLKSVIH